MNNSELIITLTLIKGLGRKTINKIIRQGELNHLNSSEIIDYLNNNGSFRYYYNNNVYQLACNICSNTNYNYLHSYFKII